MSVLVKEDCGALSTNEVEYVGSAAQHTQHCATQSQSSISLVDSLKENTSPMQKANL